jgi:uncharacterized membrane protein YidH (DUF202 family)
MKTCYSKLSTVALFITLVGIPITVARGNATANTAKQQSSSATTSHNSQLFEPVTLMLVGAALLAGAVVVRKVTPHAQ